MSSRKPKHQKGFLIFLSTVVTILFVFAVLQQALNLSPYFSTPPDRNTTLLLWALTSLNVILLVVCTLILLRNLLKLYFERRSRQLGSKFRTKLVMAFTGLSMFPAVLMALFALSLMHRNLDKWFSTPIDQVVNNVGLIVQEINQDARIHAMRSARFLAAHSAVLELATPAEGSLNEIKSLAADYDIPLLLFFDGSRKLTGIYQSGEVYGPSHPQFQRIGDRLKLVQWNGRRGQMTEQAFNRLINNAGKKEVTLDAEDESGQEMILAGAAVETGGFDAPPSIVIGYQIQGNLLKLASEISRSNEDYRSRERDRRAVRNNFMLWLGLLTILIAFSAVWIGLYLSKRLAIPIRALAEASNEVSKGNLRVQVDCQAQDELEILVHSFNRMTSQLYESSEKLERTNQDLHVSNRALEERRRYTEAVLENIPTGVVSISSDHKISRLNKAAQHMLKCDLAVINRGIDALFHSRDLLEIEALIDRASRTGSTTRDFRLHLKDRTLYCAVTLSALDSGPSSSQGWVMVLEDLTELLKAQKANAWREVARRMAHEIKNPLTPIQLSADRLLKNYLKNPEDSPAADRFETVLRECVQTIHHEVAILKGMVDEFSRFARLPAASMVSTNVNRLIEQTLASYNGRLDGVRLDASLAPELPEIKADPEQLKRVFVNLIDNALEALENASEKELCLTSSFYPQRQTVEVVVKDSGHGISPADKEKLFLPYFSTKRRGTGLGLAIASRIIADHKGYIHVEDNVPVGASFVVEIPAR